MEPEQGDKIVKSVSEKGIKEISCSHKDIAKDYTKQSDPGNKGQVEMGCPEDQPREYYGNGLSRISLQNPLDKSPEKQFFGKGGGNRDAESYNQKTLEAFGLD